MEVSGQLHTGRFTPDERAAGTHWIGGWVGPGAGLDAVVKSRISYPCWDVTKHPKILVPPPSHQGKELLSRLRPSQFIFTWRNDQEQIWRISRERSKPSSLVRSKNHPQFS